MAIPGEVIEVEGDDPLMRTARVRIGGITKKINLAYTPDAKVGDYVLVHVGFALSVIDPVEARRVFDYLDEIGEMEEISGAEKAEGRSG